MEQDVITVCLIIGGVLFAIGAVRLGMALYKAEKKIKEVTEDDN